MKMVDKQLVLQFRFFLRNSKNIIMWNCHNELAQHAEVYTVLFKNISVAETSLVAKGHKCRFPINFKTILIINLLND